MTPIALLIKSYGPDIAYAERLFASIRQHNVEQLPVYCVVPDADVQTFTQLAIGIATVLPESTFADHLVTEPVAGFSAGYINQEIIKLAFWETGLADNYFCVDSDAQFIRDFSARDFMADDTTPYTYLTEDAELRVEPEYFRDTWQTRAASLDQIRSTIGYQGIWPLTVHGHAVFSGIVLQSFKEEFLIPRGWDYADALAISPYEPSWYNAWLLHAEPIPIIRREPIVKTFHNATQHLEYVLRGVSEKDVSRGYAAVVVNSNYSRGEGVLSLQEAPHHALASYVTTPDLFRAIGHRIHHQLIIDRAPQRKTRRNLGRLALKIPVLRRYVDTGLPNASSIEHQNT